MSNDYLPQVMYGYARQRYIPNAAEGTDYGIRQSAGNPWDRGGRELASITGAVVELENQVYQQESEAEAQANLNAYKEETNRVLTDFMSNNKLGDAVENKAKLDQTLKDTKRKYDVQIGKQNPLVQRIFQIKAESIASGARMDADAYRIQEGARWKQVELQNAFNLTAEDYAKEYNNDQLAEKNRQAMMAAFDAHMDSLGIAKGSASYEMARLSSMSKINKALIMDSIGGDRFNEARHLIGREMKNLTAMDRYDLLNSLRNQVEVASVKAKTRTLLNNMLKIDPAMIFSTEQGFLEKYHANESNKYKVVSITEADVGTLPSEALEMFSAKDTVTPNLVKGVFGSEDESLTKTLLKAQQGVKIEQPSYKRHTYLIPKTQDEYDNDAMIFARVNTSKVINDTMTYQNDKNYALATARMAADHFKQQGTIPQTTQDLMKYLGTDGYTNIVVLGYGGDAQKALRDIQQYASRDTGNPQMAAEIQNNISVFGASAYPDKASLQNAMNANMLSLDEQKSVMDDWTAARKSGQNESFNIIKGIVETNILPKLNVNVKDNQAVAALAVNQVYNSLKRFAMADETILKPENIGNYLNQFNMNIGLQTQLASNIDNALDLIKTIEDEFEQVGDLSAEERLNFYNVVAANADELRNATPQQVEDFINRNKYQVRTTLPFYAWWMKGVGY